MAELSEQDRAAIIAINSAQEVAWNRGDAEAYAERVLPGIVFTNVIGARFVGRDAVISLWRRIFSTVYKNMPIRQRIEAITSLHPGVVMIETINSLPGDVPGASQTFTPVRGALVSRMAQVLVRHADGWWIASGHNVPVLPMAAETLPPD